MSRKSIYRFRLYVAYDTPNSMQARANLNELCRTHLPKRHEIEIIDVLKDPERALTDGIFMTPTLVKFGPLPVQKFVGTLSQPQILLQAMGLEERAA